MRTLIVIILGLSIASAQTCTPLIKGFQYDFSSLRHPAKDYYIAQSNNVPYDIWLNFCQPEASQPLCNEGTAICQTWSPTPMDHASMGQYETLTWSLGVDEYHPIAIYTGGDNLRSTEIHFQCDPDGSLGTPVYVGENPARHYFLNWTSSAACPKDECKIFEDCMDCTSSNCKWNDDESSCSSLTPKHARNVFSKPTFCPQITCEQAGSNCLQCVDLPSCVFCLDFNQCVSRPNNTWCGDFIGTKSYCAKV